MSANTASKLIQDAARASLRPLGLRQRGRSRVWLDDRGWFVIVVEFQPSSWSQGSYLNVGCMWLWHEKDYISFDLGHRVEAHVTGSSAETFGKQLEGLVQRAVEETLRYRAMLPSVARAADELTRERPPGLWQAYHAAIAHGLVGRSQTARELFDLAIGYGAECDAPWIPGALAESNRLSALAATPGLLRPEIEQRIQRTRQRVRLEERGPALTAEALGVRNRHD